MSREHSGETRSPKPYGFVPFARYCTRKEVVGHEQFDLAGKYSGRLTLRFKALTPVFVGTGSYALGEDTGFRGQDIIRPFYRVDGTPAIPGSSLKGAVRSVVEAVSPSCITITRVDANRLPEITYLPEDRSQECTTAQACPACSIFGRMGQLAKASFGDVRLIGNGRTQLFRLAPLYAPHAFETPPVYLDQAGKFKGRKFYYHSRPVENERQPPVEAIPPGQILQGRVDFENLSAAELGLLFFALGMEGTIAIKLGGGKPLGLGSLCVVEAELGLLGTHHFTQAEAHERTYRGEDLATFINQATDAALREKVLLPDQALALARILAYNEKRMAPEGPY